MKLAQLAEATVVALAATGDDGAFDELVRRRQVWLRGLMRRFCGDPAQADDLAQQAFLQAWQRLPGLRAPGAFGAWLRQLALNVWLAEARKTPPPLTGLDLPEVAAPEQDTGLLQDLDKALSRLRPEERTCVVLAYAEGLSHGEIAAATGLPLGTVKSHVLRGATRLRALLGD
ncbi:MAG: Sigma-W factor [Pseudomonadota bacterium]|jgi:RNA polymerase sigma-70 factor (ECF subfamily)